MASMSTSKVMLSQWASLWKCAKCSSYSSKVIGISTSNSSFHTNFNTTGRRHYSSKTPINSSLVPASAPDKSIEQTTPPPDSSVEQVTPAPDFVPHFSAYDIRELDPDTKMKIHSKSSEVAKAQAASLVANTRTRRRKEILIMDESEYAGHAILTKKPPLLDRRGEAHSFFRMTSPENFNQTDLMCFIQADIDLRPEAVKGWWERTQLEHRKDLQKYNPKRNKILGNDLAAAHVIVARGGKVKFMGHKTWVTDYRKDAKPGVPEEDLPVMTFALCTLPVNYDPRYRVEAIDATGVELHYEGLENFENLHYVKWLSLRDAEYIDDWCLDRIARQLGETLEFIDLSGCKKVTDKGIGTLHRCSKLRAIRVENMGHLENLEIVCAMLEDHNPNIEVLGIDYQAKTEQLRLEAEELKEKAKQLEAAKILSLPTPEDNAVKAPQHNVHTATTMQSQ